MMQPGPEGVTFSCAWLPDLRPLICSRQLPFMNNLGGNRPIGVFQIAILIFSIFGLIGLLCDTFLKLDPDVSALLQLFDTMVCGLFLIDFLFQFKAAKNKLSFLKTGWIDLVASIPSIDALRWGRLIRVIQIIRVLRAVRAAHKLLKILASPKGVAGSLGMTACALILFSSLTILIVENVEDANIKTAEDAIWWSFTTITTVGYGDRYPVTTEGRIIAMILMMAGVGLFGSYTALVAALFTGHIEEPEEQDLKEIKKELELLRAEVRLLTAHRRDSESPPRVSNLVE
ncbi:MAG: ion transporter [Verrucomicrobiota bacterium]|nr:ion transporter [Verrucomicrobiota bacterium]